MAKSNNQKAKILYLERLLRETGENHVVTMKEILSFLQDKGICAERKSVYDDMEVLRSMGMCIHFRRERPSGYYVTGQQAYEPSVQTEVDPAQKKAEFIQEEAEPVQKEPPVQQVEVIKTVYVETNISEKLWKKEDGPSRSLRLLCKNQVRGTIEEFFGENAEYKEKSPGEFQVTADVSDGPALYGWLTSMGRNVRIIKPRKTAQAYRDYLKAIAKEYKGI